MRRSLIYTLLAGQLALPLGCAGKRSASTITADRQSVRNISLAESLGRPAPQNSLGEPHFRTPAPLQTDGQIRLVSAQTDPADIGPNLPDPADAGGIDTPSETPLGSGLGDNPEVPDTSDPTNVPDGSDSILNPDLPDPSDGLDSPDPSEVGGDGIVLPSPDSGSENRNDRFNDSNRMGNGENTIAGPGNLQLEAVLGSILQHYPTIRQSLEERRIATGFHLGAAGEFDTKLKAGTLDEPVGFYENFRHFVGVEQPLYGGGNAYAGYRIGRGEFEPWYKERETNEGGEFKAGFVLPLWQNDEIDQRRTSLQQARLDVLAAEPIIQAQVIVALQAGAFAYWDWVFAGINNRIAVRLRKLAEDRREALEIRFDQGDIEEIALRDNERLIASRQVKVIETEQKLRQAAIKLSLFLRGPSGQPLVPSAELLPREFPPIDNLEGPSPGDVSLAFAQRPELRTLNIVGQQLDLELRQAINLYQPELDFLVEASKDVGGETSSKGDKTPTEINVGLLFTVPLQRRKALGKRFQVEGKIMQNNIKRQFQREKIEAEVGQVAVALDATARAIEQTKESFRLAKILEEAERKSFRAGESNLLIVNLREQSTADAEVSVAAAKLAYYLSRADYAAALGEVLPLPFGPGCNPPLFPLNPDCDRLGEPSLIDQKLPDFPEFHD